MDALHAPTARRVESLLHWTLHHLGAALWGLVLLLGGGFFGAIRRRQFCWRAWAAASGLLAAHLTLLGLFALRSTAQGQCLSDAWVWGGSLPAAALAGFVAARLAHRLAFWELELVILAAGLCLFALLGRTEPGLDASLWPSSYGLRLLGPLWDRMLGLWLPLAFVLALVGASLALFARGLDGPRPARGHGPQAGLGLAWRLARRHLAGKQQGALSHTALVAIVGIALGVAALVTTTAVMSGYQRDIRDRILGTNAHLVVQKYGLDFSSWQQVIAQAETVPGVTAGAPFVFSEAMLAGTAQASGVLLKGIDAERAPKVTDVGQNLCLSVHGSKAEARCILATGQAAAATCGEVPDGAGRLAALLTPQGGLPPLLVGLSLYQRLGLPLGSKVRLLTPVGMAGGHGNAPRQQTFVLTGVFSSGMHEFDSRLAYTSLTAAQKLLGMGASVSGVEFRLQDPDAVGTVGQQVLGAVGRYPFRTLEWHQLNAGIFTALTLQKVVMFLVLAFIVVVASFNVASTLLMAVAQKSRQVAVLKAMGATDGVILQTFLLEGWGVGLLGCGLGLVLGLLSSFVLGRMQLALAADVYMVHAVRVRLDPQELMLVALCTLLICHLAAWVPAFRAAVGAPEPGTQGGLDG